MDILFAWYFPLVEAISRVAQHGFKGAWKSFKKDLNKTTGEVK